MTMGKTKKTEYQKNRERAHAFVVEGNTAKKLKDPELDRRLREREQRRESAKHLRERNLNRLQKERKDLASRISIFTKLFWVAAVLFACMVVIGYLQINDENIRSVKKISALESELISLKQKNDEAYSMITGNIDLEEIRRVAIYELGMQYADQGQVIKYKENGGDYVRQFQEITKSKKPDRKPAGPAE